MRQRVFAIAIFAVLGAGCVATTAPDNVIRYNNGTVYFTQGPPSTTIGSISGVSEIRLDRDYVTVEAANGQHIIPRDRFIQSAPATQSALTR